MFVGIRPLFLVLAAAAPAFACMNEYHPPNFKAIERSESVNRQIFEGHPTEDWSDRADRLRSELARSGDFRVKNDLAVALAHAGQANQAVTLLEEIEREKPGLYVTAANLGTAYELVGDNAKALEWIRQGIKRNADSHQGSEWLHVRILEAKLALAKDPHLLAGQTILGFSTEEELPKSIDIRGNRGEKLKRDRIKDALIYQLHERVQFVNPPDAVVGSLLYDLGRLIAKESSGLGGAKDVFSQAKSYVDGLSGMDSLLNTLDGFIRSATNAQQEGEGESKALTYFAICLWVVLLVYGAKFLLARFTREPTPDSEL